MTLPVAPCPACGGIVVLGERRCRTCGQPFDYGAVAPVEPNAAQIAAALGAFPSMAPPSGPAFVAAAQPASSDQDSVFGALGDAHAAIRPALSSGAPPAALLNPGTVEPGLELDTGRHSVGVVVPDEVPGLIDSTLFAAWTPAHVDVEIVPGLEPTASTRDDGQTFVNTLIDLEQTGVGAVGPVAIELVPDVFHSDIFRADVDVIAGASQAGDLLEVSPVAARRGRSSSTNGGRARAPCPGCGILHDAPRCPSCATAHPDEQEG
jgi:hypothetical protein